MTEGISSDEEAGNKSGIMGSKDSSFFGVIGGTSSDMFFSSFAEQEVMSLINVVYGYTLRDAGTQHTRPQTTMHCRLSVVDVVVEVIAFCKLFVVILFFMSLERD